MEAQRKIALVDCNNFYVSCERLFRPDLWDKPVAVLSNNDGCIVARSQEVKKLGIKMAVPLHQVAHLIKQYRVQLFSSNYALYGDISTRVMSQLAEFTPDIEVYSIDESFLDLSHIAMDDPVAYGVQMKQRIAHNIGIPVCVGIGSTKTLAKLANYAAKKWPKTGGVVDLSDVSRRKKLMQQVPVDEVWGVGRRTAVRLLQSGIKTVWDLCCQSPDRIRSRFNVVLARTVMELQGTACLSLEELAPPKQQIVCSRSFRQRLMELGDLETALAEFCSRAAEKLREQNALAGSISVFIRTSPFNPDDPQYQNSAMLCLPHASQHTGILIAYGKRLLRQIYRTGYRYQKCGVLLGDIRDCGLPEQLDVFNFDVSLQQARQQQLMQTVDSINRRFAHSIGSAAARPLTHKRYQPTRLSPRYTTDWSELQVVKCH